MLQKFIISMLTTETARTLKNLSSRSLRSFCRRCQRIGIFPGSSCHSAWVVWVRSDSDSDSVLLNL